MRVDLVELEYLAEAQQRVINTMRRQLRRLRDIHRAHDFLRFSAQMLDLDSVTLAYAFDQWVTSLSDEELERLKAQSRAHKSSWRR